MPSDLSILLLSIFSSLTLTLPTPQPANSNPPLPGTLISCTPHPATPLYIPPPTTPACAIALRALPSTQAPGAFHAGAPADDFQLPLSRTYGSCTVAVELAGGRPEETSSWLQIGLAATQLAMACVDGGRMGGRTVMGVGGGVVVSVRESGGVVGRPWKNGSFVDA